MENQDSKILWIVPDDFTIPEMFFRCNPEHSVAEIVTRICMRDKIMLRLIGKDGNPLDLDLKVKDINDDRIRATLQYGKYGW